MKGNVRAALSLATTLILAGCAHWRSKDDRPSQLSVAELTAVPPAGVPPYDVFVLNLGKTGNREVDEISALRLAKISQALTAEGIPFQRFPGIYGKRFADELDLESYRLQFFGGGVFSYKRRRTRRPLTLGEIGHLTSFTTLNQGIVKSDRVTVLIEDDTRIPFAGTFKARLETLIAHAPADWDIIFLYCRGKYSEFTADRRFARVQNTYATNTGQIIHPRGAKKFAELVQPYYAPTDVWIEHNQDVIRTYCAYPEIALPGNTASTIKLQGERKGFDLTGSKPEAGG